jgi:hypothetical protein
MASSPKGGAGGEDHSSGGIRHNRAVREQAALGGFLSPRNSCQPLGEAVRYTEDRLRSKDQTEECGDQPTIYPVVAVKKFWASRRA